MKANLEHAPATVPPQEMSQERANLSRAVSARRPLSVHVANNSFLVRTRL